MVFCENNNLNTPSKTVAENTTLLCTPVVFVISMLLIISRTTEFLQTVLGAPSALNDSLYSLATLVSKLIFPLVSVSTAYSITGINAVIPGLMGGYIAGSGATLLSLGGDAHGISGIYGALIAGYGAGYIVKFSERIFRCKNHSSIFSITITIILTLTFILTINQISYILNYSGTLILTAVSGINPVLLSVIIGIFMTSGCMGPLFISSFVFASAALVTGNTDASVCINATMMVPGLSFGIFSILYRNRLSPSEKLRGLTALAGGFFGIPLSSVEFYASNPIKSALCCIPGGCIASVLCTLFRCTQTTNDALFSIFSQGKPLFFILSVICGVLTSVYTMSLVFISEEKCEKENDTSKASVTITA